MQQLSLILKTIYQKNTDSFFTQYHNIIIKHIHPIHSFVYGTLYKTPAFQSLCHRLLLLSLLSFSSLANSNAEVDLLVVVEPEIFSQSNPNRLSREKLHALLTQQLNTANSAYNLVNIHYNVVAILDWEDNAISQLLNQGDSYHHALHNLMNAIIDAPLSSITDPTHLSRYDPRAKELLQQYFADKLIFITQEKDTSNEPYGAAFHHLGLSINADALMHMPSVLAHLLGHSLALNHPPTETCQSMLLLMCSPSQFSVDMSIEDMTWLSALVKEESLPAKEGFDPRFYLGAFSPSMPALANIQLTLEQSQLSTTLNLQLIDEIGDPKVLEQNISVELFTQSGSAIAAFHYPESLYQRVTFLAGETHKQIIINTQSSDHYADFTLGTRYGILVSDSNTQRIQIIGDINNSGPIHPTEPHSPTKEINPNPNPSAPAVDDDSDNNDLPATNDNSGEGSGAMTLMSLLILIGVGLRRKG
ncbi:SVAGG family GlyGly-CTERM protein [Shewanella surugensis]|uniref:SVAGG family GlyGly-CTERM protein n=1 Tax=Shewanella surugensis TaxID=212020 RepID=A0ABT0LBP3_9GAMM|nr:SVAGG family GlyGly-CTERM protein [Shewanella surugensis]MCL1124989.1 SVAGG family GlyGly-CTERM protein [Shewanella surugensis]